MKFFTRSYFFLKHYMLMYAKPAKVCKMSVPCFAILLVSVQVHSQTATIKVTGRVTDDKNTPIIGASVTIKNGTGGTSTNNSGVYTINVNPKGILVFSATGLTTQEVNVAGKATIDVNLTANTTNLDQVVVVGYGTQRKKDVTGSVTSVNLEAQRNAPNTNIGQFLQGTAPGLNVGVATSAGGTPPISIRGINTISGSTSVLIILDGIQYTGSLSSINPDDIASIDVLKDASSTAVYGAQAANGVILITSRKGKSGVPRISLSSSFTTQSPTVNLRPRNRDEFLEDIRQAYFQKSYMGADSTTPNPNYNVALDVDPSMKYPNTQRLLPNNTNWWDDGTKTGLISETNLSISGGSERFNYLLSGSLVDQRGFVINDKFKRKTLRANLETKPFTWWKVGLISSGSFVNQDGAEPLIGVLVQTSPLLAPYDSTGKLIPYPANTLTPNPFTTYFVQNYDRNNYYFANVYSDIDFPFLKGLSYRMNFGNNYRTTQQYGSSTYAANLTGQAYKNYQNYYDYTFDNIVTFNRTFGKHAVTATLLYGAIERTFNSTNTQATGFSRLNLSYNDLSLGTTRLIGSTAWREALNYQMARINYKFNDRYLLTATVRRDGFSGFAQNFKSALFPTAALGWIVSEESFMKNIKAVDNLKLRVGYGISGNQTSRYSSIPVVNTSAASGTVAFDYVYGDGASTSYGQIVASLGNPDLKWEKTRGLNFGLDFGVLQNRITGTFDYYHNITTDLLFGIAIPTVTGFNNIQTNVGKLVNNGFEASVTGQIIKSRSFNWSSTFNFWLNRNKVQALSGIDANRDGVEDDIVSSGLFIGRQLNSIYDYQTAGIYQLSDRNSLLPGFFVGSMRITDQDNSKSITTADRTFLGSQNPAYRFSWINNFSYKGFNLSVFINSIQGGKNDYLGNNARSYFREDNSIRNNELVQVHYWSPANSTAKYPRITGGSQPLIQITQPTTANITANGTSRPVNLDNANYAGMWESRSFIRLQDVSLSYNLGNLIKKPKFQNLNLYVSGKNLVTWTNWEGWDPETGQGLLVDGRPVMRAYTIGLNITY